MTNDKTPGTATDASEGKSRSYSSFGEMTATLKDSDGERHEFFPLSQVPDGATVELTLIGEPVFDKAQHHGKFSMFEVDVRQGSTPYRLCVSGTRLAKAIAALEPKNGSTLVLTAKGPNGRERKWTAAKAKVTVTATLNGHG